MEVMRCALPVTNYLDKKITESSGLSKFFTCVSKYMKTGQSETQLLDLVQSTKYYPYSVYALINDLRQIERLSDKTQALEEVKFKIGANCSKIEFLQSLIPCKRIAPKVKKKIELIQLEKAIVSLMERGSSTYLHVQWSDEFYPSFKCEEEIKKLVDLAAERELPTSLARAVAAAAAGSFVFGGVSSALVAGAVCHFSYKTYSFLMSVGNSLQKATPRLPEVSPDLRFRTRTRRGQ